MINCNKKIALILMVIVAISLFFVPFFPQTAFAWSDECIEGNHKDELTDYLAPTENKDGYAAWKCGVCGREYTEIFNATGHIWSKWIVERQPTEMEPGLMYRVCTRETEGHREWKLIPFDEPSEELPVISTNPHEAEAVKTFEAVYEPANDINESSIDVISVNDTEIMPVIGAVSGVIGTGLLWMAAAGALTSCKIIIINKRDMRNRKLEMINRIREAAVYGFRISRH